MVEAAKQRGGLRPGEDLTALPSGTTPPSGDWKSAGTVTAPGTDDTYDVYTRDPAPVAQPPANTPTDSSAGPTSATPPGTDALKDIDNNFSPNPPGDTVTKCAGAFAEGFVSGFVVGFAVGFVLAALGPVGAVIGVGLLLYSAYQLVTNWDKIQALPPEDKARLAGNILGGVVGGGLGAKAGAGIGEGVEGSGSSGESDKAPEIPEGRAGHIFRDADGHLPDTPANRQLLQDTAGDPANTLGSDQYGNTWSAKTLDDGTQVWVQTRNGQIINGGLNEVPRTFNPQTGLSSPTKP